MKTLQLLEKTIDKLSYKRAMIRIKKKKSIKTWERLDRKLKEFTEEERKKIIKYIIEGGKCEK